MHGLRAAVRVNDDQAAVDEHRVRVLIVTLCIRAARRQAALHALSRCGIAARIVFIIDKAADSTHRLLLLYMIAFHVYYAERIQNMRKNHWDMGWDTGRMNTKCKQKPGLCAG